jgi:putative transcriptional regulator
MEDKVFAELLKSAHQALDHARGKLELRTTTLPPPPPPMDARQVKRLRTRLKASQAVFAHYLTVSTKLVQAWESARRTPDGPALLLLRLTERNPAVLLASNRLRGSTPSSNSCGAQTEGNGKKQ